MLYLVVVLSVPTVDARLVVADELVPHPTVETVVAVEHTDVSKMET